MSDLIERLRDKKRLRAAHGLTGWVLADESLHTEAADEIERLRAALQHEADCVEAAKEEIERLTAERDNARERSERTANLLVSIHALLYPPPVTLPDGRTFVFRPENPDPHAILQTLSDRIRALPDEIAAINAAKEQR